MGVLLSSPHVWCRSGKWPCSLWPKQELCVCSWCRLGWDRRCRSEEDSVWNLRVSSLLVMLRCFTIKCKAARLRVTFSDVWVHGSQTRRWNESLPQKDVRVPISISLLKILYISIKTCYDHAMRSHPDRWGLQLCLRCSHLSETWTWSGHSLQPNKNPTVLQLDCSPGLPLSSLNVHCCLRLLCQDCPTWFCWFESGWTQIPRWPKRLEATSRMDGFRLLWRDKNLIIIILLLQLSLLLLSQNRCIK